MSLGNIKYSFIIPVKAINDYVRESVPKILEIDRNDFEIIIYPDKATDENWPKTRQVSSGPGGPAMKRDLSVRDAHGDFLIFIDDDAYPEKNILDVLDRDFEDLSIAVIGGPALTPKSDNFQQKVSGAFFLSFVSGGFPERYRPIGRKRFVFDWPSVNLSVRKSVFLKLGGFQAEYWPGEDTKFCLDIVNKLKERNKILYDPEIIVWHHRRSGLFRHLKQVGSYGLHRGYFAKIYPETSFKLKYFIPSLFVLFVIISVIFFLIYPYQDEKLIYFLDLILIGWLTYITALITAFFQIYKFEKNALVSIYALFYTFLSHLVYGIKFIQGYMFTKKLHSKLR
jgi:glycosyltransferase involved in cell wall biosynthesis